MIITVDAMDGSETSDDDTFDVVDLSKVNRPPGVLCFVVVASCCTQDIVDSRTCHRYVRTPLPSSFAICHVACKTSSHNSLKR